jgi:two-component system CheB/CheR fusion protein
MLQDVISASERAARLTRQLLAYAGKERLEIAPTDVNRLTTEITPLLRTSIPKTVHLKLELQEHLPYVEADQVQLQQVIMNMVINAAEAIPEGQPGLVTVTTSARRLSGDDQTRSIIPIEMVDEEYVTLTFTDTGAGMTPDVQRKIFDPFFTTKFMGRGLGLAATLGIVRGHNGSIKVYSTPGQGTTFKVLIPAAAEKAAKRKPESQKDLRGFGAVLVVDDEEIVRKTAATALERYGYEVLQAENGPVAIDLLHAHGDRVSLVLLDMTMPLMSGEEVFRRLKAISPQVPIIVSSGYNEVEAVRRFTGRGIAGFIQKPYTAAQLAEKIKGVLEQRESAAPPV